MSAPRGEGRIFLSPPWTDAAEEEMALAAFRSGYVAPCGPFVDEFERELAARSGRRHAVATSSGTAALALVMAHLGVDRRWTVVAPTLTFVATVGPAFHRGARLAFVDCDATGGVDAAALSRALAAECGANPGRTLFVGVDLYGRCCDYGSVEALCAEHGALFVSDSAEAFGATHRGRPAGSAGVAGVYSFNGNKIITTSGGGAVVTDDKALADHVRKLSQQSREPVLWYEHREVGFNCRMSNVLGAVGVAQARKTDEILRRRRANREFYREVFSSAATARLLPDVEGENCWLTVALMRSESERDALIAAFAAADIESRPVWKPMHLQPVFTGCTAYGGETAESLFRNGVCLPSGSGLDDAARARIRAVLKTFFARTGQ